MLMVDKIVGGHMYNPLNTGRGWGAGSYKIYNNPSYFPTFGGGRDFFIQPNNKIYKKIMMLSHS